MNINSNGSISSSVIPRWTTRQVVIATLYILGVILGLWLFVRFYVVIFVLFVAIVMSTAIAPSVEWLHQRKISRAVGVILIYFLLTAAITGFILLVVPLILNQITQIGSNLPDYYDYFRKLLVNSSSFLIRRLGFELPAVLQFSAPPQGNAGEDVSLQQVSVVLGYAGLVSRAFFIGLAIFLLGFYWTLDGERTTRSLLLLLPSSKRDKVREVMLTIEDRLGSYIRGQVLMCLSIAALALILYLIVGVPYALSLAIFAGLMEAVPMLGPTLGAIPPAMVLLGAGEPTKVIWLIIGTMVIQTAEGYLLIPRIMGKSVGVSPLVTLLAIAAFSTLLGIPGAFLAIPIAAVVQVILDQFLHQAETIEPETVEGRDTTSVLHLEIQDLTSDIRKHVREKDGVMGGEADRAEEAIEAIAMELDQILTQSLQTKEQAGRNGV